MNELTDIVAQDSPKRINRADVLDAAARLFSEQGYQQTSTRQIAAAAGLKAGSIYHHFKNKEDILHALIQPFIADIVPAFRDIIATTPGPYEAFRQMLDFCLHIPAQRPHIANIAFNERTFLDNDPAFSYVDQAWAQARDLWREVLEDGARKGVFRNDLDAGIVVQTITALIASVAHDQIRYKWPVDMLIETQMNILMRGLEPEDGSPDHQ